MLVRWLLELQIFNQDFQHTCTYNTIIMFVGINVCVFETKNHVHRDYYLWLCWALLIFYMNYLHSYFSDLKQTNSPSKSFCSFELSTPTILTCTQIFCCPSPAGVTGLAFEGVLGCTVVSITDCSRRQGRKKTSNMHGNTKPFFTLY